MPKRSVLASAASRRAVKRARLLIEHMLKEMQKGMADPAYLCSEHWERVFGPKQNMVANLQKLVAALGALPEGEGGAGKAVAIPAEITPQEMALLKAWLEETR